MSASGGRIFVAAGSTAISRSVEYVPMAGWVQGLWLFMAPGVDLVDCSRGMASLKSYWDRGRFQWVLDQGQPGEYVLICLGRNDRHPLPGVFSEPFGAHQEYLYSYVAAVRSLGMHPVLVVGTESGVFDGHGSLQPALGAYPAAMREVAERTFTPLVDLQWQTQEWWLALGPARTRDAYIHLTEEEAQESLLENPRDTTHFRPRGAIEVARALACRLRDDGIVPPEWITGLQRRDFTMDEVGWLDQADFEAMISQRRSHPPTGPLPGYQITRQPSKEA